MFRVLGGYGVLAAVATAVAFGLRDGPPWNCPDPWLALPPGVALWSSLALGVGFAMVIVVSTRAAVARFAWAQRLHNDLRPVARNLTSVQILAVAGLSSLGEELFFRALLVPTLGVMGLVAYFGLAHQMRGRSRWIWTIWATAVGAGLGAIFRGTGSLMGPLVAHAVVNAANLAYLRDYDPDLAERVGR